MQDHELVDVQIIQRLIVEECPRDIKDTHHHQIYHKGDYHTNLRAHMIEVKMGRVFFFKTVPIDFCGTRTAYPQSQAGSN